jgi:DNA-binding CsgD family transcriptional regulator
VSVEVVGREAELASVARFLDGITSGPTALLILGDAGIGKTTVWQAGVATAIQRSHRALVHRAVSAEAKLPFTGLGDLLGEVPEEAFSRLPAPQRRALDIALLKVESEAAPVDWRTVSTAVLGVVTRLAEEGPLVLAIDDVQWLDASTDRVLGFAIRRFGGAPAGILVSVRGTEDDPVPLGLEREAPPDRLRRVTVGPMSDADLGHLLRARLGSVISPSALRRVDQASGGNPFFALEIARTLLSHRSKPAPGEPLPIPDNLMDLVKERVARLTRGAKAVLPAISALSQPTVQDVRAALGGPRATIGLARATDAGVVEVDGHRIRFTHPLFSSAVYAGLSPSRRRALHARLAAVVGDPDERARHLSLGAVGTDAEAAAAIEEAGHRAIARGATEAGAEMLERAYRLTPLESAEDARRRGLAALAHYEACGQLASSRRLCEELLSGWPPDVPRGELLLRMANARVDDSFAAAADLFEQALVESGGDRALETTIHNRLGYALYQLGSLEDSELHDREALRLAEEAGEPNVIANALLTMASDEVCAGRGIPWDLVERYMAMDGSGPEWWFSVDHQLYPAMLMWTDRLSEAREGFERLRRMAHEAGAEGLMWHVLIQLSELESRSGNYERSMQLARQTEELVWEDEHWRKSGALIYLAYPESHLGLIDAARAHLQQAREWTERGGATALAYGIDEVLGFIELSLGNPSEAHRHLGPSIALMRERGEGEPGLLSTVPGSDIEALIQLGHMGEAKELLEWFEERSRALDRASGLARCARCRGLLLAGLGDLPGAAASLEEAVRQHDRIPDQPFELARTLLVRGGIERRAKQKRAAGQSLRQALEIFERLGTPLWAAKARAELGRIGGRPPVPFSLTPTEERVARLVAEGRTNKEVAAALFMSVNTVQGNLRRIYQKLGVRSRSELTAKYARRDGFETDTPGT